MKFLPLLGFGLLTPLVSAQNTQVEALRTIEARIWHLGNDPTPEWTEAPTAPEGGTVEIRFQAQAFPGEGILFVQQRDVNNAWVMQLNGHTLATLEISPDELTEFHYAIPAGLMRDGENKFTLVGLNPADDILFGNVRYAQRSIREYFNLRPFALHVFESVHGSQIDMPARITIVDESGSLAPIFYAKADHVAVRPGILYTGTGRASAELPVGRYTVYASRGMEWSRAKETLLLGTESLGSGTPSVELQLVHEVGTPGFIAADTHIHTLTHSGHGDASVEERQITLAGEGVELAIATDHNHNTDYGAAQQTLGLSAYYTTVVGNEVTTPIGHFNAFPLGASDPIPLHDSHDLAELLTSMRSRGARTVILNHPRWPEGDKAPFANIGLDSRTGFWKGPWASGYDAMELVNSDTLETHPLQLFRDWFALMNRGERVFSVGASDSHEVGVVVGQGRTYVQTGSTDVSALNVEECSDNIANGRSSVSMGIFAKLCQGELSVMGQNLKASVAQPLPAGLRLRIAAPSWVTPQRLMIFANGQEVWSQTLDQQSSSGQTHFDSWIPLEAEMKLPSHDYWLVAVVMGAKVTEPFWPLRNDYTLASTNPIFVDVDGDGEFSCARRIAESGLAKVGTEGPAVLDLLSHVDGAVAAQIMRLVEIEYRQQAEDRIQALEDAALKATPSLKDWVGEH